MQLPLFIFSAPMMIQICSHEKVTTVDGVIFEWPVTAVGSTASFKCPKNSAIKLQRKCNAGGQWEMFDQRGCGVLAKNFTNIVEASKNVTIIFIGTHRTFTHIITEPENHYMYLT